MISSISAGGFTLKFDRYSTRVSKSGKCQYCGKQTTRSTTFEMHKSIFNTNPDGTEMTAEEINKRLEEKAAKWKADLEVYHNGCRRSLVIDKLRSNGFVCSEESDCIKVWLSADHSVIVDYDRMCVEHSVIKTLPTLGDLVAGLVAYREKNTTDMMRTQINNPHLWISKEPTEKSGKTFIHSSLSVGVDLGSARCDLHGIGDNKEDAFLNSLKALVILGEKAKNYLEKQNDGTIQKTV